MSKETLHFQAEVKQLLQLMIHSLYSNKDIFLRELISNACDAQDKLRFEALKNPNIKSDTSDPFIKVSFNEEEKTITIQDNGIGMNKEELVENLGTIAKSGTKAFLAQLSEADKKEQAMIGQFGVGFYSSFIVAKSVDVITRRAGETQAYHWHSEGQGEFDIEPTEKEGQGTEIILHLRDDATDLLNKTRLTYILKRYSDHVSFPILMKTEEDWETINMASALWTRNKAEITKEQYESFYQHISHDYQPPLAWTHNHVEGRSEYTQLLYIPRHASMDLWDPNMQKGLNLYVKRVFIMNEADQLLPMYLRFIKGVVDSNDLPLNVSREILQDSQDVRNLREANTKRILKRLEELAKQEPENYQIFWNEFGQAFKQGTGEDPTNLKTISSLLRFTSTHEDSAVQKVSLQDYVSRMKEDQTEIYYLLSDRYESAKNSPHLELLQSKGIEVLLMTDRIDEWMMTHFMEFDGKPLVNIAKTGLDLSKMEDEKQVEENKEQEEAMKPLIERFQETLKDKIKEVKVSHRLVNSPVCVVGNENELSPYLAQMLKAAGQEIPKTLPILEINPKHPMIEKLQSMDNNQFSTWASVLLNQALLCAGMTIEDPNHFVQEMNQLLMK